MKLSLEKLIRIRFILHNIFFILIFICIGKTSNGNINAGGDYGMFLSKNYHPSIYKAESQNWSVAQDDRGVIYIANLDGVLEFDGVSWRLVSLPGKAHATSLLYAEDGLVYVGSHSGFGYIDTDDNDRLKYFSLLDKFPEDERTFSFIWDIFQTSHGLYMATYEKLYRYYNDTIQVINKSYYSRCYIANDNVYIFDVAQKNLQIVKDNKTEVLVDFNEFDNNKPFSIISILPYKNDQLLYFCSENGFFTVPDIANNPDKQFKINYLNKPKTFRTLIDNEVIGGIKLSNGYYAYSTSKAGVFIVDTNGNIVRSINSETGLINETVNFMLEDMHENLWLALDNGLSVVNITSPVTFFNQNSGYQGTVLDILKYKSSIFIGAWQGVYKLVSSDKSDAFVAHFEQVKNIYGRAWKLISIQDENQQDKYLYAGTSTGIYRIHNNTASLLIPGTFIDIIQLKNHPEILFASSNNGVSVIHFNKSNGDLKQIYRFDELENFEIYRIIEDNNLMFWLAHRNMGITLLQLHDKDETNQLTEIPKFDYYYSIKHFDSEHGLPKSSSIEPVDFNNEVLIKNSTGFYNYFLTNSNNKNFKCVCSIWNVLYRKLYSLGYIATDHLGNFWIQVTHNESRDKLLLYGKLEGNHYNIVYVPLSPIKYSGINKIYFEIEDKTRIAWFAGDDAIVRYNISSEFPAITSFKTLIRKITINNSETYYYGNQREHSRNDKEDIPGLYDKDSYSIFPLSDNTITFEYAAPLFHSVEETSYSVFLENYDNKFSVWNNNTSSTYSNLPPGKYTFYVISRDMFGNESEMTYFTFMIKRPWYMQTWMFFVYIGLLVLFIFYITRLANKRLVTAKANLEKLVKERTSEIAKQRQLIEVEKEKSDMLLRNILPLKIGQELKSYGTVKAQYYDAVTVMFMDFKDFSKIAQYINPFHLIAELDKTFGYFDEISMKHNLEKIKTMGDAYLCAGGIPQPNMMHPFSAIFAAFEILNFLREAEKDQWLCDLRIGIHTGELIAGVIGKNKFTYDIWGETVNTAARMEASGVPGKINISGDTYIYIKDYIECAYRGKLPAKHKDEYDMYFATRIKKEYSADENGTIPNQKLIDELLKKFS
ncbi:MAG: adenylate/guanylate cyclase domain-containing protein [Bacteroidales bacterium]